MNVSLVDFVVVLYSHRQDAWKVADMGITIDGGSDESRSTRARGKSGYRAPELLFNPPKQTKKVDIWGLGCILIELATGEMAFASDECIREYAYYKLAFGRSRFPFDGPVAGFIFSLATQMLNCDRKERPKITFIVQRLLEYDCTSASSPKNAYNLADKIWLTRVGEDILHVQKLAEGLHSEIHEVFCILLRLTDCFAVENNIHWQGKSIRPVMGFGFLRLGS